MHVILVKNPDDPGDTTSYSFLNKVRPSSEETTGRAFIVVALALLAANVYSTTNEHNLIRWRRSGYFLTPIMVASPSMMYALVARGKTVLAEYTFTSGNFPTITRVLLAKIPEDVDTKMSYQYDEYAFHYLVDRGITFLCMADQDFKRRVPFTFLDDIRNRWFSTYGDSGCTAIAFAMNEDFGGTLERQLEYFNANPNSDQIGQMQSKLEDVKNIMIDNIDQVLERGEKLEILVDRTDQLNQQAFVFQKQSTALKNKMFWKKVKTYCVVALGVVLLIYIILAVACGGLGLKDC